MKKILFFIIAMVIFFSCGKENENMMYVNGNIKGLKKGTLYLQKQIDTLIVSVDSIQINGTEEFSLSDEVITPEMYYLTLGNSDKKIIFFGEPDSITINSRLDKFIVKAEIKGSKNQDVLDDYYKIKKKFNDQNLDLIKAEFDARKSGNQDSLNLVNKKIKNLIKRKYLYTANYAINNANFEAAPYIALTELNNATLKLLDTVQKSLSDQVKKSKYGKQLEEFVNNIRLTENK